MARMHPFDEAIDLQASAPHEFTGATHPAYANMIGPFGGTTSAQLLQSAMLHPDRLGEPVALTVNFAAPLADRHYVLEHGHVVMTVQKDELEARTGDLHDLLGV